VRRHVERRVHQHAAFALAVAERALQNLGEKGADCLTIADMSAWGWLDRASCVRKGEVAPFAPFPHLKRLFQAVEARPAVARARAAGTEHGFKKVNDEETKRALFPSNYPSAA
jgi:GST-like protein